MKRAFLVAVLLALVAGGLALRRAGGSRGESFTPPPVPGGWVEDRAGLWAVAPTSPPLGIGELSYAPGYEAAGAEVGVTFHERGRAQDGWNLYCSGHGPEAVLMDMDGTVVHRWRFEYGSIPGAPPLDSAHQNCWRRVRMLADGGLLAIYGGRGLIRIDRDSNLVWHFGERVHHDLEVLEDGGVLTLVREERLLPAVNARQAVIDDFVVELSPGGEVRSRLSVLEALLASPWGARALRGGDLVGDVLHTNSLRRLDGSDAGAHPALRAGNLLLCARDADLVFAIDPRRERAVWTRTGPWSAPHDPRAVGGGRVLVFDNLGASTRERLASRLVEFDVRTGEVVWEWPGGEELEFYSRFCGVAARLADGHTLVTETGAGRAFELDGEGVIVWRFDSPHRAGPRDELVAALFELERLPRAAAAWLE